MGVRGEVGKVIYLLLPLLPAFSRSTLGLSVHKSVMDAVHMHAWTSVEMRWLLRWLGIVRQGTDALAVTYSTRLVPKSLGEFTLNSIHITI